MPCITHLHNYLLLHWHSQQLCNNATDTVIITLSDTNTQFIIRTRLLTDIFISTLNDTSHKILQTHDFWFQYTDIRMTRHWHTRSITHARLVTLIHWRINYPTLTHTIYYTHTTSDCDPLAYKSSDTDTRFITHLHNYWLLHWHSHRLCINVTGTVIITLTDTNTR